MKTHGNSQTEWFIALILVALLVAVAIPTLQGVRAQLGVTRAQLEKTALQLPLAEKTCYNGACVSYFYC